MPSDGIFHGQGLIVLGLFSLCQPANLILAIILGMVCSKYINIIWSAYFLDEELSDDINIYHLLSFMQLS